MDVLSKLLPQLRQGMLPMKSTNWKDIAELIGITAIVVSLMALVLELRQTHSALVSATYQARAVQAIEHNTALQEGERMLPLLARVNLSDADEVNSLTPEEKLRLRVFFTSREIDADNEYFQYENGYLSVDYYEYSLAPQVRREAPIWRSLGIDQARPSFKRFVDQMLTV